MFLQKLFIVHLDQECGETASFLVRASSNQKAKNIVMDALNIPYREYFAADIRIEKLSNKHNTLLRRIN
jgi:hypothetical protein